MAYKVPALIKLMAFISELKKKYGKDGNPQRTSFITLIKSIAASTNFASNEAKAEMLLALLTFELEKISKSSSSEGWLWGSRLRGLIETELNLAKTPLTDDMRLILINKLYHYLDKNVDLEVIKQEKGRDDKFDYWPTKSALLTDVKAELITVYKREIRRNDKFITGIPVLASLNESIDGLEESYKKNNPKRKALLSFVEQINNTLQYIYPMETVEKTENNPSAQKLRKLAINTRLGLILFAALVIYKEYWLLHPKGGIVNNGSDVFKDLMKAINVTSLGTIKCKKKISWLKKLEEHFLELSDQKNFDKVCKEIKLESGEKVEFSKQLNEFLIKLKAYKLEQEIKFGTQSYTSWVTEGLSTWGAAKVIDIAVNKVVPITAPFIVAFIPGIGQLGYIVYSLSGMIIMSGLGQLVKNKVLPAVVAGIYGSAKEKMAQVVGNKLGNVVGGSNNMEESVIDEIDRNDDIPNDEKMFIKEYIKTFLTLPDDPQLMSNEDKEKCKKVMGIKQNAEDIVIDSHAYSNVKCISI